MNEPASNTAAAASAAAVTATSAVAAEPQPRGTGGSPVKPATAAASAAAVTTSAVTAEPLAPDDWARLTAHRLRVFHAHLARDTAESRDAFIEEELRRLLDTEPAPRRDDLLAALAALIPDWPTLLACVRATLHAAAAASARQSPDAFSSTSTAKEKIPSSVNLCDSVPLCEKTEPATAAAVAAPAALALANFAGDVSQLLWRVWQNLAPKSRFRRDATGGDIRAASLAALAAAAAAPAVPLEPLHAQLAQTRQLLAAIIGALAPAAADFSRAHLDRFSPDALRDIAKLEGASTSDAALWRRYAALATELDADTIQTRLLAAIVTRAETLTAATTNAQSRL